MKTEINQIPKILAMVASIVFAAMYFVTALPRVLYPYDLDFLEDSVLMQSVRIARHQPVYIPPNADFNPHVYTPLYFWLGGILFMLGGPSLLLLRLLSLGATLATAVMVFWVAKRESGLNWIAISCAGLFFGGYGISGFWYELARVDSLFLALTFGGVVLAVYAKASNRGLVLSALFLALATFTKQTGSVVGVCLALYLFLTIGRRAWWFLVAFCGLVIIPLFGLNMITHGWFFYHIFHIGSADPIEFSRLVDYLKDKIFGIMSALTVMAISAALLGGRRLGVGILREQPWLIGIGIGILISGMGRIRVGGNLNNLMPAYAFLCLSPAILVGEATHQNFLHDSDNKKISPSWRNWLVTVLILCQFALGRYSPSSHIPSAGMRQSADRLIQQIASIQGPVFVMMHPYYNLLAGKDPATQIATLWYVRDRGALPLPHDLIDRIRNHYYAAIVSDESYFEVPPDLHELITAYYYAAEPLDSNQSPATNTGVTVRPKIIYLPIQP
jgi:4-amino-4-deoxy-L-arabinose transferase-like glycosyltransferase